jgi:6-phosphofructokinase 2
MKKVVTLTVNPAIDKSTRTPNLVPEKKLRCESPVSEPGGGGINVSRVLKKLGANSLAFAFTGGFSGKFFEQLIFSEGIDFHPIPISGDTRENFIVVESSSGSQFRFGMEGPLIFDQEVQNCLKIIEPALIGADFLVASGSLAPGMPVDFYAQLALLSKKSNCRLILDTSGKALELAARTGAYLLKPNLNELSLLMGREELQAEEIKDSAQELIRKGFCEIMVVSLGQAGAMMVSKDSVFQVSAPLVKKQSTVGAGDSMVAGLVWSLSREMDLKSALQFGVACGTAATMNPGTELCRKEDVERLFEWIRKS